ncbi:MAG: hypothetical protein ACLT2T_04540 [Bilophila wadsworthia]
MAAVSPGSAPDDAKGDAHKVCQQGAHGNGVHDAVKMFANINPLQSVIEIICKGVPAAREQNLKEPAESEDEYRRRQDGYGQDLDGLASAQQWKRYEEEEEGADAECPVSLKGRIFHIQEELAESSQGNQV